MELYLTKGLEMNINDVLLGDSVELMKQLPDKIIDLVVTSPPYDMARKYEGNVADSYTFEKFQEQAKELYRVMKKGGVIIWVVGDQTKNGSESGTSFKQALYFKEIGFKLYDTMIYRKNYYVPLTHRRYEQAFEYMFVLTKGKPNTFNGIREKCSYSGVKQPTEWNAEASNDTGCRLRKREGGYITKETKLRSNIWNYSPGKRLETDNIANKHPAIFPYELARDHILSWSNEGDLVFDPMCGSGTTLIMAKQNKRNYLGMDIIDTYVDICKERLERITND